MFSLHRLRLLLMSAERMYITVCHRDDHSIFYDYPFSTPAENAVNKRIIERPISGLKLKADRYKSAVQR